MFTEELYAYLDSLGRLRVHSPHHPASYLLFAELYSDGVTNRELMLNAGEQRTAHADIEGASMLGKDTAVRAHTPHT